MKFIYLRINIYTMLLSYQITEPKLSKYQIHFTNEETNVLREFVTLNSG